MPEDVPVTPDTHITCAFCTEQEFRKCRKCNRNFCIMHANRFSPNFCKECFANLSPIESKFTRTFEDYNTKTEQVVITKESCTRYYMDGPDWPFVGVWIDSLSDDELKGIWNFHFFIMKMIEAENENRKIKNAKRLRETPVPITAKIVTQTTKKTVTKQQDTPEELRKKLTKQGLPAAVIDMMVKAMTGGA